MPSRISVPMMSDKSPGLMSPFVTAFASCGADASVPTAAFIRLAAWANLRSCMMTCTMRIAIAVGQIWSASEVWWRNIIDMLKAWLGETATEHADVVNGLSVSGVLSLIVSLNVIGRQGAMSECVMHYVFVIIIIMIVKNACDGDLGRATELDIIGASHCLLKVQPTIDGICANKSIGFLCRCVVCRNLHCGQGIQHTSQCNLCKLNVPKGCMHTGGIEQSCLPIFDGRILQKARFRAVEGRAAVTCFLHTRLKACSHSFKAPILSPLSYLICPFATNSEAYNHATQVHAFC